MLDRVVPPWILIILGVVLFGYLSETGRVLLIIALVGGHFAMKHYTGEGLFWGKYGKDRDGDTK